jgi:hypothetical protein
MTVSARRALAALLAASALCGCRHVDRLQDGSDGAADSDTDTDSDTDSGSTDSDTDADTAFDVDTGSDIDANDECSADSEAPEWGTACGDLDECPPDTICAHVDGLSPDEGVCAPECCVLGMENTQYCSEQTSGDECCALGTYQYPEWLQPYYCVIVCEAVDDCPEGTDCKEVTEAGLSICYGFAW